MRSTCGLGWAAWEVRGCAAGNPRYPHGEPARSAPVSRLANVRGEARAGQ